jgi:hypothetical protein
MAELEMKTRTEERRALKNYLARYYKAREKQVRLQSRLKRLQGELRNGDDGSLAEIEARITRQTIYEGKTVLEIMDIIDLLPADSTERTILELRHIDCRPWKDICKAVYLTRSPCYDHYNKALDKLLKHEEVQAALSKHRDFSRGKNDGK